MNSNEPIAIIGMSCIFPGAKNIAEFWQNIVAGNDSITEIQKERWDWREFFGDPARDITKTHVKHGGFIDGADQFDAAFFKLSPSEAEAMDPQQRLVLEHTLIAMEDAGYAPSVLAGSHTGVFIGSMYNDYRELIAAASIPTAQMFIGNANAMLANRVSFQFDFRGPSESIDTACSSSLVAVHRGVQSLLTGESDLVFAGGVTLMLTPMPFIGMTQMGLMAKDGRCKTFSKQANGIVRGEGCGLVVLKKLSTALQASDRIYAVIKGSAINHGGHAGTVSVPNPHAQADVLRAAYNDAGIDSATIGFIEAHGTGTALGDPIEIAGLKRAFAIEDSLTVENHRCFLGSVKSNIGHLEPASGIAGLIKVVLSLQHKTIPKTLHVTETTVNSYLELNESPFKIAFDTTKWQRLDTLIPRRAGISSFGFGGANCHVVLEEYEAELGGETQTIPVLPLFVLSARNEAALMNYAKQMASFVNRQLDECSGSHIGFDEFLYTVQVGRGQYECRLAIATQSFKDLAIKLSQFIEFGANAAANEDICFGVVKIKSKQPVESRLSDLVKSWQDGHEIDFYGYYLAQCGELKFESIKLPWKKSLPTYPFQKKRFWISGAGGEQLQQLPASIPMMNSEQLTQRVTEIRPRIGQRIDIAAEVTHRHVERLICRLLLVQLQKLAVLRAGSIWSAESLRAWQKTIGMPVLYERWLQASLRILCDQAYLQEDNGVYTVLASAELTAATVWSEWESGKEHWLSVASLASHVSLIDVMLRALPEILTGKKTATDMMFPNSSLEQVEGIYKNNPLSDYFNEALSQCLVSYIEERLQHDASARIRILEIGAGTGGTSEKVFEHLKVHERSIAEYCYTDLSKAFLMHAERTYGPTTPYLTYRLFNVERAIEPQGIEIGAFDVVIATSVLHATKNIRHTLRNAKAALRRNGVLLLNEISGQNLFAHLTFGLLEGWWLSEDTDLRIPGTPALSSETWRRVLAEEGFHSIVFPTKTEQQRGLQIIAAQSDGAIRQQPGRLSSVARVRASNGATSLQVASTDTQERRIHDVIRQTIAASLKVDAATIDGDESFAEYGLDSIVGVQVATLLAQALSIDLETATLFANNTVNRLAAHVTQLGVNPTATVRTARYDDRTVRCIKSSAEPVARLLIFFCFGFGEESYRWVAKLPNDIEVWTVGATSISNWDELVTSCATDLRGLFDKPVVAWGHSMGGIVAFEVLNHLEKQQGLAAKAAIFSSASAPAMFSRAKYTSPFYEIDAAMSEQEMERRLVDSHLIIPRTSGIPLISPAALRNDIALIQSYCDDRGKQLAAPLLLIQANNDVILQDASVVVQWEKRATQRCHYEEIDGTHLFFMNPPKRFINLLIETCRDKIDLQRVENICGVYELNRMTSGTQDMHLYPLGADACGYIIYGEDGQMAAHIWHRSRTVKQERRYSPVEASFTYLAYAADYRYRTSIVDHDVIVSTIPDLEGKTLRRYVDVSDRGICLSTSPVVMQGAKQEGSSAYQQLTWKQLSSNNDLAIVEIAGSWSLNSIMGLPEKFFGSNCKGRCIVANTGLVSVLISTGNRQEFALENPMLATDQELQSALETSFSWLGRLDTFQTEMNAIALVWQAFGMVDLGGASVEKAGDKLKIGWRYARTAEASALIQSEWSRRA